MDAAGLPGLTQLLLEWRGGDETALERLMPLVYADLRSIARRCLRDEKRGEALETTELVNEAYLRLVRSSQVQWRDRTHFFAMAARLMRRVLLDEARKRGFQKPRRRPRRPSSGASQETGQGAGDQPLPDRGAHRRGRNGGGVSRARRAPAPHGRAENAAGGAHGRPAPPASLAAGGVRRVAAEPPEHRHDLRDPQSGRRAVDRHRVHRGADAARDA